ncbi:hypothetical protein [Polyangium sp. 15x6]|uniref:hypothetical protein n=1 Tax=Polyangium sp. 15x6 TaxID=3042687 RepID=UPI00249C4CA0|nr:hypothetical protein [Polyangium sp. 15x6]MDI3288641.1 hypothetical protein [Polyangium sp. 15x6]
MLASLRLAPLQSGLLLALALGALGLGCKMRQDFVPNKGPGFDHCGGDVFCSPGQHCADFSLSVCEEGCLTDDNCDPSQMCDPDAAAPRQCIDRPTTDAETPMFDNLVGCKEACKHFESCGLAADEATQCLTDCEGFTPDQQSAFANCGGDVACSDVALCLNVQCVSTNDCQNDQSCVKFACVGGV